MIISGIQVEKKLTTQVVKLSKKHKKQDRPHSSEFPDIYDYRRKSNVIPFFEKKQQARNHSSNKVQFKSNLKLKKQQSQQQNQREVTPAINVQNKKSNASNNKKTSEKTIGITSVLDISSEQERKLMAYFRYYPVSFIAVCGQKQQFFKSLKETGDFKTLDKKLKINKPKQIKESCSKLLKVAQLKGKYKYREKINYAYSVQLKAINYKRKQWKKKKQSESSSSEDQGEKRSKCRDLDTWKKAMGVKGSKVFIIKGKYKDLRNALLQRGWVQNEDKHSNFFDLKWTTKISDINFQSLKPGQIVNHFNNNACLTSKYGLCKSLRSIMYSDGLDIDRFFPKAYDLADLGDFENFLQMYKIVFCESILKKFISNSQQYAKPKQQEIGKEKKPKDLSHVRVALMLIERKYFTSLQVIINNTLNSKYAFCNINQWNYLSKNEADVQEIQKMLAKSHLQQLTQVQLYQRVGAVLDHLKQQEPQVQLNGMDNIWIVKPAFLSRGRGIKCFSSLSQILDYSINKETQYVVQKYIQNPLIVLNRKFDIRQWVIIQDYNPPRVWFYGQFYLRFCLDIYNPANLKNKYAHLTNNSIQKTKKIKKQKVLYQQKEEQQQKENGEENPRKFQNIQQSMWTQQQFNQYLEKNKEIAQKFGPHSIKNIISKMKQIVIASVISTQDQVYGRKNTFQLIGYDFMLDSNLNPWLIQINSSPSMDYSTPVTRKLVKMVLQDTVAVLTEGQAVINKPKKKRQCGQFKCIYKGQEFKIKNYAINNYSTEEKNQK